MTRTQTTDIIYRFELTDDDIQTAIRTYIRACYPDVKEGFAVAPKIELPNECGAMPIRISVIAEWEAIKAKEE